MTTDDVARTLLEDGDPPAPDEGVPWGGWPGPPPAPSWTPPTPPPEAERPDPGWYGRLGRRPRIALWLLLLVWLGLGGLLLFDGFPSDAPDGGGPAPVAEERPDPLLVVIGGDGEPPAMALLHEPEEGSPVVVLLAVGTVVEVPGVGPRSLNAAFAEHGRDALATAVANALGIEVPDVLFGGASAMRDAVDSLGGVEVDVPETVEVEEGGRIRVLFSEGRTRMDPDAFLRFLTTEVPGQQEVERVARQSTAWEAFLAELGRAGRGEIERILAPWQGDVSVADAAGPLARIGREAAEARVLTLPVRRVGLTGTDLYEVDEGQLDAVRESLGEVRTVTGLEGHRVRLLVGVDVQVGPAVARRLIEAGYRIVLTGRANEPYDVTRAVIAENTPELRERGGDLLELMGTGRLGVFRRSQTVFDVTLVVGRDWAEANGFVRPEPASEGSSDDV